MGGSGFSRWEGLADVREQFVSTPFGEPSDAFQIGTLDGIEVAFLARHGRHHTLLPGEIPYRANVYAMKALGVQYLLSLSTVSSLRSEIAPFDIVFPTQFVDLTQHRQGTFFGGGAVAHVSMVDPVCQDLCGILQESAAAVLGASASAGRVHRGGTYACMEGPVTATRSEQHWLRNLRASVVGMTAMPEAKLAREAEMAYATVALVCDGKGWKIDASSSLPGASADRRRALRGSATATVGHAIRKITQSPPVSPAFDALQAAFITPPAALSSASKARLHEIVKKYL
jgi:5'-methylthioadenosine phosphorylase